MRILKNQSGGGVLSVQHKSFQDLFCTVCSHEGKCLSNSFFFFFGGGGGVGERLRFLKEHLIKGRD